MIGTVETGLRGLWPSSAEDGTDSPARLVAPRGLRSFLIGAAATSQTMGKLSLLGLPVDPLQAAWALDGSTIGGISVQVIDDDSADPGGPLAVEASTLSMTTSGVAALWRLDPLAVDDDDGAALADAYADLMTTALAGQAGTAEFQAAAAGQALADTLQEGRQYLADTASRWMTAVLGLVRLRAAQQADPALPDAGAQVEAIVQAYNQATVPLGSPVLTYLAQTFLGDHVATRDLPDAGQSIDGGHFTDALRSAIRHTGAGSPIDEDGGPGHAPDAGPDPGDLGAAVVAAAIALAGQVQTYTQDPAARWDADKADCSSFVQRALFGAGLAQFDPGTTHTNVWSTKNYAERDDVFATVKPADARPGDVLVQGGYKDVGGTPTWKAHTGIFRRPSPTKPDLLEGISMDSNGPTLKGLWGADPPRGYYAFGSNLLVRRLSATCWALSDRWSGGHAGRGRGQDPDRHPGDGRRDPCAGRSRRGDGRHRECGRIADLRHAAPRSARCSGSRRDGCGRTLAHLPASRRVPAGRRASRSGGGGGLRSDHYRTSRHRHRPHRERDAGRHSPAAAGRHPPATPPHRRLRLVRPAVRRRPPRNAHRGHRRDLRVCVGPAGPAERPVLVGPRVLR